MKPLASQQFNPDFVLNPWKWMADLFFTNQSYKVKKILSRCMATSSCLYIEKSCKHSQYK